MGCPHFPLLDALDLPEPIRANYCRLTHPGHPNAAKYRDDLESWASTGTFRRAAPPEEARPVRDVPPAERPDPERPAIPAPRQASTRPYFERLAIVQACDYRGEQVQGLAHEDGTRASIPGGCGCARTWHCAAGRGTFRSTPFEVAMSECLECVKAESTDTPAAP